jgi:hypothetical protein
VTAPTPTTAQTAHRAKRRHTGSIRLSTGLLNIDPPPHRETTSISCIQIRRPAAMIWIKESAVKLGTARHSRLSRKRRIAPIVGLSSTRAVIIQNRRRSEGAAPRLKRCQRRTLPPLSTLTLPPILTHVFVPSILTKPAPYIAQGLPLTGCSVPDFGGFLGGCLDC